MQKSKNPIMSDKDILCEVCNRTGLPFNTVYQAMCTYYDVIKECIASGVEAKIGHLGVMKWRIKPPNKNVVYYDFTTREPLPPVDTPGFNIPMFTPSRKWKQELKEITKFEEK